MKPLNQWAPSCGPARPAAGAFPYPHRTIAEIDREYADRRAVCESVPNGPGAGDWDRRLQARRT